jgi:hypothetical protein
MKNQLPFYLFFLLFCVLGFTGCDLFGDEEHCKNEIILTKTWNSSGDVFFDRFTENSYVYFLFGYTITPANMFNIPQACPFGTIAIRVNIFENKDIFRPDYYKIFIYKVENINGKKIYKLVTKKTFFDKPDANQQLILKHEIILDGLLDIGPVEYVLNCSAQWGKNAFSSDYSIEDWASKSINKIDFKANYFRWE